MSTIHGALPTGLFVAEAEPGDPRGHISQAIAEMYESCTRHLFPLERNVYVAL